MQSRKLQIAAVAAFCGFIGLMGILYMVLPKEEFSGMEKRVLAKFPEASVSEIADGSFTADFETWMSDHLPGRNYFVGTNAVYELLSGRNGLNGVIYYDGRLFAAAEKMDGETITGKCARINLFAEETGLPVDVMLVSAAGYVYSDALPLHEEYPDRELAGIVKDSLEDGIGFIWPEEILRERRDEGVYYRTDHHLTSRGTYEICSMYAKHIGAQMPGKDAYETERHEDFFGSMYAKSGLWNVQPDHIEIWRGDAEMSEVTFDDREPSDSVFFREHLGEMDKYPVFMDGNHGFAMIDTGREEGQTLLVVRDSFGHCFAPFAADIFSRVAMVDLRYYRKSVTELAGEIGADRVLVLYGTDTFITDTNFGWLR